MCVAYYLSYGKQSDGRYHIMVNYIITDEYHSPSTITLPVCESYQELIEKTEEFLDFLKRNED